LRLIGAHDTSLHYLPTKSLFKKRDI